jgi:AraC family transcriptional regulator, regulatory protein of adaptative response / DNA-3-methyladenine glycosylase II
MIESNAAYHALAARDPRFDGVFYVGVTSTGIYCRPICPVKTPMHKNCRFFETAGQAEKDGFRPCLRCRPELAPGAAPVDDAHRIAHLIAHRIEEGQISGSANLEDIAEQFELSSRQIRRIVQKELGVSPIELLQTRRLLLAKQLLTETSLPVTEIAFASGFSSLRRFNDAFSRNYRMTPSRLRKEAASGPEAVAATDTSMLQLTYRPPYDWPGVLEFLAARMIKGVEYVTGDFYARTIRLGAYAGWIKVTHAPAKRALLVEFTHSLTPVLPTLLGRLRDMFDLNARPDIISAHLKQDKHLARIVEKNPGLRVPGAFDGYEMAIRAILGQQITVKAATTIARRLADAFGSRISTPFAELYLLPPMPDKIAAASIDSIAKLGIVSARTKCLIALSQGVASGALELRSGLHPEKTIGTLMKLPGIGPWTAHYIAMRALHWPDAFPRDDIAVRNNLGKLSWKQIEAISEAWRPWRSYAVLHIWKNPQKIENAHG